MLKCWVVTRNNFLLFLTLSEGVPFSHTFQMTWYFPNLVVKLEKRNLRILKIHAVELFSTQTPDRVNALKISRCYTLLLFVRLFIRENERSVSSVLTRTVTALPGWGFSQHTRIRRLQNVCSTLPKEPSGWWFYSPSSSPAVLWLNKSTEVIVFYCNRFFIC